MGRRSFTQLPFQYGDGKFGFALAQTRNGQDEFVMLVGLLEWDPAAAGGQGLWLPPGVAANPARFRVDARLSSDASVLIEGQYGATRVPVKVDPEGRLVFAADVTVNAEGLVVDLGQIKQGPAGTQPWPMTLAGSFNTIRNMIGATKTATSVASEVFAGASRLSGRRGLWIKNEHPHIRIRVDGPSITPKTGVAVEPFASVIITFDPAVDVPVYVISEAGNAPYGVVEW